MVLLLVVLNLIHLLSQSFKFKLLFFSCRMSSFMTSVLNCANASSELYVFFSFSNRYSWSLSWNSDTRFFSHLKHVWMLTQINFYYLHIFWNIKVLALRQRGKCFSFMPVFIIYSQCLAAWMKNYPFIQSWVLLPKAVNPFTDGCWTQRQQNWARRAECCPVTSQKKENLEL